MKTYFIKRLLQIPPVLLIITFMVFCLVYLAGDPVLMMLPADATNAEIEQLRSALGLDQSFIVQFGNYFLNLFQGDFGTSLQYNQPALPIVLERLPATLFLASASMIIAILISIPLGIVSAIKPNSIIDLFSTGLAVLGKAIPNFWLGIMLILMFAVNFRIFPVSGSGSWAHLVLPAITLGTGMAAEITRLTRSSMVEIISQDYIKTARSKGLRNSVILFKHAFKNALVPVITVTFLQVSSLIGGSLITEMIFSWPGLGQLLIQAVYEKDLAIIQAAVFVIAVMIIGINLFVDILYKVLDPRINLD
ncbi:ABC transporter permease [Virgibacillus halodenitrificans]|uniref:ABC transporter permease n=1 Tax=Virgibacillus halodenitrificans TaxID=1482 RepID=UPI001367A8EB|nr:ABC transporter permease [Virgibacillus halodenitrificans]MEC2159759.1 ABC transporter permease [Virgibacillus halodenitrificans]MYL56677.1 ABC transporter permease subunit [Virgibacillus halodenitrificans]